jgi:Tol biopolymer transport system component
VIGIICVVRGRALIAILGFALVWASQTDGAVPTEGPQLAFDRQKFRLPRHLDSLKDFGQLRFKSDVLTSGPSGEGLQRLLRTHLPGRHFLQDGPAWSPDGQMLAVTLVAHSNDDDETDIYVLNRDGSGLRRVTHLGNVGRPVFSTDGSSLFFARPASRGRGSVWSVSIDGTGARQLASPIRGEVTVSSVSPVGDIALSRGVCTDGTPFPAPIRCRSSVVLLSPSTGTFRPLLQKATDAAFSPDGNSIAYIRETDDVTSLFHEDKEPVGELFIADLTNGQRLRLTRTEHASEATPSWDPSGQRIVFVQNKSRSRLLEINADGTCATPLAQRSPGPRIRFLYNSPTWQPGPGREAGPIVC